MRRDRTAVQLDEGPHQRQPQPQPALVMRRAGVGRDEGLEQPLEHGRFDADALISHGQLHRTTRPRPRPRGHGDLLLLAGELEGVVEQVAHHLVQANAIAFDPLRTLGQ